MLSFWFQKHQNIIKLAVEIEGITSSYKLLLNIRGLRASKATISIKPKLLQMSFLIFGLIPADSSWRDLRYSDPVTVQPSCLVVFYGSVVGGRPAACYPAWANNLTNSNLMSISWQLFGYGKSLNQTVIKYLKF